MIVVVIFSFDNQLTDDTDKKLTSYKKKSLQYPSHAIVVSPCTV